jgi:hypothetical protein
VLALVLGLTIARENEDGTSRNPPFVFGFGVGNRLDLENVPEPVNDAPTLNDLEAAVNPQLFDRRDGEAVLKGVVFNRRDSSHACGILARNLSCSKRYSLELEDL